MNSPAQLTVQRIVEHDPLAKRLSHYIDPARFAIAGLVLGMAQSLVLPGFAGVLKSGSLADWPNLVVMLILLPLILGWYAWQPLAILKLYQALLSRVEHPQDRTINPSITLLASHKSRGLTWLVLGMSLAATAALALRLSEDAPSSWENASFALFAVRLAIRFIIFYALLMFLVRQILVTIVINRFFKKMKVSLNPLHPDESGGWRILGKYTLNSAGLVMVVGLLLSLQYIGARWGGSLLGPEFPFEVMFYLIAGPAVFFLPLLQSHKQMLAARNKLLVEIAEEFEQLYQTLISRLAQNKDLTSTLVQLEAVEELYAVISDAPSWPFNFAILSRFGGLIAVPILFPAVVDVIASLIAR